MLDVFLAILPVFLVMAVGVVVDRAAYLPAQTSMMLSVYVLRLALPVLLFKLLAGAAVSDVSQGTFWLAILAPIGLVYLLGYFGDLLVARRGQGPAVITAMAVSCCNAAFIGLPIVTNLFPGNLEALLIAGLVTMTPTLPMTIGQSHLDVLAHRDENKAGGHLRSLLRTVMRNPFVVALCAGMLLCLTGLGLWTPLDRVAGLIGMSSAPCALLALGLDLRAKLRVALKGAGSKALVRQSVLCTIKLIVHPLLTWALLSAFGVSGLWLVIGVLMSSTATGVGVFVVADVYHTVPEEAALGVVMSNGLSLFTMSAFAMLFKVMGYF